MSDRELLELAAKAAAYEFQYVDNLEPHIKSKDGGTEYWNPLTDDGDALRLAVKLGFTIDVDLDDWKVEIRRNEAYLYRCRWTIEGSEYKATREAILGAAAAIGEDMP